MSTEKLHLKQEFTITEIVTLHFFEYKSDFIFKSEYHDYWKLLYVEEGTAEILCSKINASPVILQKGEAFLQAPNEYYSFKAGENTIPILFTAGFYCSTASLKLLKNKVFLCQKKEQNLLSLLAKEGKNNFSPKITGNASYTLERKFNQPFGGEQLIRIYLEMLLISLTRQYSSSAAGKEKEPIPSTLLKTDSILFNRITDYYRSHITQHIKIEELCAKFSIGRSHLQRIFREQTGCGAIEYFCRMRISIAKQLIRENKTTLTDIANELGYTSIHYFSKQFKHITGINPSQYQKSIRIADKDPLYQQISLEQKKVLEEKEMPLI